jgi:putative chitinase
MSLKAIQSKLGLNPDGIFGPNTAKAIQKHFGIGENYAAHFLAQCGHETGHWRLFEENLNYSKTALLRVFGKYFNEAKAEQFQNKPVDIANIVYGGRMGNTEPGDGWKYRGRGAIQLTGKWNYEAFAKHISNPSIVENPDLVTTEYALESAKFFFDRNNVWRHCNSIDPINIQNVTKAVNGGFNGLKEREELTKKYYQWLINP